MPLISPPTCSSQQPAIPWIKRLSSTSWPLHCPTTSQPLFQGPFCILSKLNTHFFQELPHTLQLSLSKCMHIFIYTPLIIFLSQNKLECLKCKSPNIHNSPPLTVAHKLQPDWQTNSMGHVVSFTFPLPLSIFSICFSWFYLFNVLLCSLEVLTHCWKWNMDMKSLQ